MNKKVKNFLSINNEDNLMIVLAFMSFSIGLWTNYRQLWLQGIGYGVGEISRILSVALICSAVISFIISIFSTKVNIKSTIQLSNVIRSISMILLLIVKDDFMIKICMLLSIMCEVIFSIAYYPLLALVNKSDETYRKKALIDYISQDAGIIICGLLIGTTLGNCVFDYNTCLFLAIISNIISGMVLIFLKTKSLIKKQKAESLKHAIKTIFNSKITTYFLGEQLIVNMSYGIVFGIIMLILTDYLNLEISAASIFIIVSNVLAVIVCSLFSKYGKNLSVNASNIIKFGTRTITYFIAAFSNNMTVYLFSIAFGYISCRILDDKVTGTYLKRVNDNAQFLFGNMRYFVTSLGRGIGTFLAGVLLSYSLSSLFLGAAIATLIQSIMLFDIERLRKNRNYN